MNPVPTPAGTSPAPMRWATFGGTTVRFSTITLAGRTLSATSAILGAVASEFAVAGAGLGAAATGLAAVVAKVGAAATGLDAVVAKVGTTATGLAWVVAAAAS